MFRFSQDETSHETFWPAFLFVLFFIFIFVFLFTWNVSATIDLWPKQIHRRTLTNRDKNSIKSEILIFWPKMKVSDQFSKEKNFHRFFGLFSTQNHSNRRNQDYGREVGQRSSKYCKWVGARRSSRRCRSDCRTTGYSSTHSEERRDAARKMNMSSDSVLSRTVTLKEQRRCYVFMMSSCK